MKKLLFLILHVFCHISQAQVIFSDSNFPERSSKKIDSVSSQTIDIQNNTLSVTYMGKRIVDLPTPKGGRIDTLSAPIANGDSTQRGLYTQNDSTLVLLLEDSLATLTKKIDEFTKPARLLGAEEMYRTIPSILPIHIRSWSEYRVSSGFGLRIHPIRGTLQNHTGVDFPQPLHAPVFATADGVVDRVVWQPEGIGLAVYINHPSGYQTGYGHLTDHSVLVGQTVKRGQQIGRVGSTGSSTAPHLHYTVLAGNQAIDPTEFCFLLVKALKLQETIRVQNK